MPRAQVDIQVANPVGLHARPASLFVRTAAKFSSQLMVANKTTGSPAVNAKSILSVLTLGVMPLHEITLTAEGDDAEAALLALQALIESDFGEENTHSA
jgi:phosphotransferase system HPr (HPr) family protein